MYNFKTVRKKFAKHSSKMREFNKRQKKKIKGKKFCLH